MRNNKLRYSGFVAGLKSLTLSLGVTFISLTAFASGGIPVTPADMTTATCDTTYYESLRSRAVLEGNRRLRQAQNYIRKPDSVLDYSCFGILNNIAAEETEQIFSESHAGHCYPDSLDCSLDRLVISALTPYFSNNFNHTFLGGRSNLSRAAYDPDDITMCTVMRDVWELARCQNFMPVADSDGFLTFNDYASVDPRTLPAPCTNPANDPAYWNNNIENAFRPTAATAWHQPILDASTLNDTNYSQYFQTGDTAPGCGDFVPTGIIINDYNNIFYTTPEPDGICTNPACFANTSQNCVPMTF